MSNKICIVGDRHFGIGNQIFLESQLKFDYEILIPYCKKNDIDTVIFPGDIFDNRKSLDVFVQNKIGKLFEDYEKSGLNIKICLGNHDVYHKNSNDVHSLKWLEKFNNVKIYQDKGIEVIKGKKFLFVGWQHNLDEYINYVTSNNLDDIDVCIGHFDTIGSRYSSSRLSEVGLEKKYVMRWPLVFSGHYHSMSIEKKDNKTLIYCGTPYQLNRGDIGDERGFFSLDLDTSEYQFIKNDLSIKFVEMTYGDEILEDKISGNVIDLNIPEKVDIDLLETFKEKIWKCKPVNVNYKIILENRDKLDKDLKFKSLRELFFEYVETIDIDDIMKEKTLSKIQNMFETFNVE